MIKRGLKQKSLALKQHNGLIFKTMPITKNFSAGTVLFRENEHSREMYIILEGRLKVYRSEKGQRIDITELTKGGIVGEMSLLDGRTRSATIEVAEDSVLSVIAPEEFEKKSKQIPEWFLGIIRILCARLRDTDRRLKTSLDDEVSANVASLLSMLANKKSSTTDGGAPIPPAPSAGPAAKAESGPSAEVDLKFAKKEMVEILSLTPDRISSALSELAGLKLLGISNNRIKVPDKSALLLYSRYKRGTEMDPDIDYEKVLSDNALAILKMLYEASRNLKPDKNGDCVLPLGLLGTEANRLFSEGEFLQDLQMLSVVGYDEKALLQDKTKEMAKITVNRKKIATVLAQVLFGRHK